MRSKLQIKLNSLTTMIKLKVNIRSSETQPKVLEVTFFNDVHINIKFDSVASTFSLQMYFDPNNPLHAEIAAVSHMHECSLFYVHETAGRYKNESGRFVTTTDELIITGFMLSQVISDGSAPAFMQIGGYTKTGVLQDCDIPTNVDMQSDGLTFRQIVNKILPYFGNPKSGGFEFFIKSSRADSVFSDNSAGSGPAELKSIIANLEDDADLVIPKSTAPESTNVLSYLKELAIQKDLTLSHDVFGNLIVNAPYTGNDYLFEIGTDSSKAIKCQAMTLNYNGQAMHSQIEGIRQPDKNGGNKAYAIIKNPLVPVVYRPKVISITSGDDNTIQKAVRSELGNELKNVPLKITLDRPTANGKFIMPNNTILVKNRNCYLYELSKWFIEEIDYKKDAKEETFEITAVLPGVYGGDIKNPFIDPHKNLPKF